MKVPFLDINKMHKPIQPELDEAIKSTVESGWYIGGDIVRNFENEFAKYLSVNHCVGCGSGTDALELILRALEIGPGDEVIVPSFTWVSDAEVVHMVGAKPVLADVEDEGHGLSVDSIKSKITTNTKAIIAVHLYGVPCDIKPIVELAKGHDLKVIEDCAQAHGATVNGSKVGGFGDAAAFSFYPTKNLGALGDAGAVVTNDSELAKKVRLLANHGQVVRDEHVLIGRNSRLDSLQAAVLSVKLKYLDQWNAERRRLAKLYIEQLKEIPSLQLPEYDDEYVYHLFVIRTEKRDALKVFLEKEGIQTAIHYPKAIHQIGAYESVASDLQYSEQAAAQVLSLPLYPGLSSEDVEFVAETIRRF